MGSALYIDEDGVRWDPYVIVYECDGSQFSVEVMATSFEDAEHRLALIAATGKVVGYKRVHDFNNDSGTEPPPMWQWT